MFQIKHLDVPQKSMVNKTLQYLEGEGAKVRKDFLHKFYIIMEYNINTRTSLTQK